MSKKSSRHGGIVRSDPPQKNRGSFEVIAASQSTETSVFSSPYPPPAVLREYNDAIPKAGDSIVEMVKAEQVHRHEMNRGALTTVRVAQVMAFVVIMSVIGGGFWLLATGHESAGVASFITALSAILIAYITGKVTER